MSRTLDRAESLVMDLFSSIEKGQLRVVQPNGTERLFGAEETEPTATMLVKNRGLYDRIVRGASLGLGEGYMDGDFEAEDDRLMELLGVLMQNNLDAKAKGNWRFIARMMLHRLFTSPTTAQQSRENVAHHYDLGNEFYAKFLDPTMTYSCGYQLTPQDTLEQMQRQKYELISQKLSLQPNDRLVDIGCGWGGMLAHAAQEHGTSGIGVTLSEEQASYAQQLMATAGLNNQVLLQDYRDVKGSFDKFVSIGMFEHVGRKQYPAFFGKARELLTEDGVGLLHTIASTAHPSRPSDPWGDKYIFPGGRLPRHAEIAQNMREQQLTIWHVENLRAHYAETLRHWSKNFVANQQSIAALSPAYDERFQRMWYYYLQGSEASFRYGGLELLQVLFTKDPQRKMPVPMHFHVESAKTK